MNKGDGKYVMGVDPYGYDGNTCSICVIKKVADKSIVVYSSSRRDVDWEAKVKEVAKYFSIPEKDIITEKK